MLDFTLVLGLLPALVARLALLGDARLLASLLPLAPLPSLLLVPLCP